MSRSISLWLTVLLAGCASGHVSNPPLPAQVLYNGLRCGDDLAQPAARWIDDRDMLAQRYSAIGSATGKDSVPPALDFKHHGILLISMGSEPTTGYRLNFLHSDWARLHGSTLQVKLTWQSPDPGGQQAQVITHPCLLLQLPNTDFNKIQILDQDGTVKLTTGRSATRAAGS